MNNQKVYEVKHTNGTTTIGALKKLARNGEVLYVTYNPAKQTMAGVGSGFFPEMQRRFKAVRENFANETEFLAYLGLDKTKMQVS